MHGTLGLHRNTGNTDTDQSATSSSFLIPFKMAERHTAGLLAPLAGTGLALATPLLGAVAVVLGAGAVRRRALRLALRSAWQENKLALIVLKFLGIRPPKA